MGKPKEWRYRSSGSRFGPGKVHRYLYSREAKMRYVMCRGLYNDPHGQRCDDNEPITCAACDPSLSLKETMPNAH